MEFSKDSLIHSHTHSTCILYDIELFNSYVSLKDLFLKIFVYVCVCVFVCMQIWRPEEVIRSFGLGLIDACELSDVGARI